jgi:hypothetical protein
MATTMEYKVVYQNGNNVGDLVRDVNLLLAQGWQLAGGLTAAAYAYYSPPAEDVKGDTMLYQALFKAD